MDKICVFCDQITEDISDDHLFSRNTLCKNEIILNPILVPACKKCNNEIKSNAEQYCDFVLSCASGYNLTDKQERYATEHMPKGNKEHFRHPTIANVGKHKMVAIEIDWNKFETLIKSLGIGLLYEYNEKKSVLQQYSRISVTGVSFDEELDVIKHIRIMNASDKIVFNDGGRFNNKIKYYGYIAEKSACVYIKLYEPLFGSKYSKKLSRMFRVRFGV